MNVLMSKGSVCNFTFIIKMIYAFAKRYPLFTAMFGHFWTLVIKF